MDKIDIEKIIKKLDDLLSDDLNETQMLERKNTYFKANISPLNANIKNIPNNEKAEYGKQLKVLNDSINQLYISKISKLREKNENKNNIVDYDITISTSDFSKGGLHPVSIVFKKILEFFKQYNFTIETGSEVEDVLYNFDNLNLPEGHPTRDTSETFYLENTKYTLRTQGTAHTARVIHNNKNEEIRYVIPTWVYRNDDDDATHSHQFHQLDFVWVKKGLTVRNLKWLVSAFNRFLFGPKTKTKFFISNYSFTEPSFEFAASCPFCNGKGCNVCKKSGWITLGGLGILHDNVMKAANIKDKVGIAGGFGIERMAMMKFGITDARDLYKNDFRVINQIKKGGNI